MSFQRLQQELKIRRYSPKTMKAYFHYNQHFLTFCKKQSDAVTKDDVRNYLEYLADKNLSSSTMRLAYNSLLFYYSEILNVSVMNGIKIPKRDQKLTIGLTKEEVYMIINNIKNHKHRLLVELIYASGLRAQEAVKVKYKDILINEKLLVVRAGKGRKDRKTIISEKFIRSFQDQNNQEAYLFPGRKGHLTTRSVQQIIKQAVKKTNIKKRVYPHLIRHAFATHLHSNKTDVRYIQKLLGHKDSKTTEGYVSVSEDEIKKIKSPHDRIEG